MEKRPKDIIIIISWILIILGLIILFGYIFGKIIGWIHSPEWYQYIPYIAGGLTMLGIALQTGKVLQKVTTTEGDVKEIDDKVGTLITDVTAIKTKTESHDIFINKLDDRVHEVYKRGNKK